MNTSFVNPIFLYGGLIEFLGKIEIPKITSRTKDFRSDFVFSAKRLFIKTIDKGFVIRLLSLLKALPFYSNLIFNKFDSDSDISDRSVFERNFLNVG